jgi:hypothetical protein
VWRELVIFRAVEGELVNLMGIVIPELHHGLAVRHWREGGSPTSTKEPCGGVSSPPMCSTQFFVALAGVLLLCNSAILHCSMAGKPELSKLIDWDSEHGSDPVLTAAHGYMAEHWGFEGDTGTLWTTSTLPSRHAAAQNRGFRDSACASGQEVLLAVHRQKHTLAAGNGTRALRNRLEESGRKGW